MICSFEGIHQIHTFAEECNVFFQKVELRFDDVVLKKVHSDAYSQQEANQKIFLFHVYSI